MTDKFLVVRKTIESSTKMYELHGGYPNATAARTAAHLLATENPGQVFTIIQIIGHAVADLVRDLEP